MKYLWHILIIVALLLVGGYVLSQFHAPPSYTPPNPEPPGKGVVGNAKLDQDHYDVLITLTDDGFSPEEVTVAQGTRVRFLNTSSGSAWPASGVHPTHTLYPEKESSDCLGSSFDACQDIAPGEFYDFTFYYPGTWPYHDHTHAYHTGRITVTASSSTQ